MTCLRQQILLKRGNLKGVKVPAGSGMPLHEELREHRRLQRRMCRCSCLCSDRRHLQMLQFS